MEISVRDLVTMLHGMGFGVLFMLAFSGAIGLIYATSMAGPHWRDVPSTARMFRIYLVTMAVLAWLSVLSGAYLVYPWYRAKPTVGARDLADYPQRLLLSSPMTAGWHNFGMEWKEHVAWIAPYLATAVAFAVIYYGAQLVQRGEIRRAAIIFFTLAFAAAGAAGLFGAFITKAAPVA